MGFLRTKVTKDLPAPSASVLHSSLVRVFAGAPRGAKSRPLPHILRPDLFSCLRGLHRSQGELQHSLARGPIEARLPAFF